MPTIPTVRELTDRQRADLLQGRTVRGITRVTVDVEYVGVKREGYQEVSWYVDVPSGLKGAALQAEVLNQLYARMAEEYSGNFATQSQLMAFIAGVSFRDIDED